MAKKTKEEWFYLSLGHRRGPVTKDEIEQLIVSEDIYVDSTKVWREGMEKWVKLVESKDFASIIKKLRAEASKADVRVRNAAQGMDVDLEVLCRGVNRSFFNVFFYGLWLLPLLFGIVVITELQVFQALSRTLVEESGWIPLIPLIIVALIFVRMACSRMKNAGFSSGLGWTILVPVVNIWTILVCLCAPRNFGREKKPGWGSLGFLALLGAVVTVIVLGLVPGLKAKDVSPLAVNENMTIFYQDSTDFTRRYNNKQQEKAGSETQREQRMKQKEQQQREANRSMREKRGL